MATYKLVNRLIFSLFFLLAGAYHFINPSFYIPLIPDYFIWKTQINFASGAIEISIAILIWYGIIRKFVAVGTIVLLICFIPSHLYFIQIGCCVKDSICVPDWLGWVRLLIIHPILIYWSWITGKF